jgi:hypothetical protein
MNKSQPSFWFSFALICFTVYTFLCSIYSDIIVQHNTNLDFISLPFKSFCYHTKLWTNEKKLDSLIENDATHSLYTEKTYIFVIDISGSVSEKVSNELLTQYNNIYELIGDYAGLSGLELNKKHSPDLIDVSLAFVFKSLIELANRNQHKDKFTIWALGDEGFPICDNKFVDDYKTVILNQDEIRNRIKTSSQNTDFTSLFRRLLIHYPELNEQKINTFDSPSFIVTIISDMLHDVDKKIDNFDTRIKNWEELEQKIQRLSNSPVMVNLVLMPKKDKVNIKKTIFSFFSKNIIEWYRLNDFELDDVDRSDLLSVYRRVKNSVIFYYTNPFVVENSCFTILSDRNVSIRFQLPYHQSTCNLPSDKISLHLIHYTATNDFIEEKRIVSGGNGCTFELKTNQKLELNYSGNISEKNISPILQMTMSDGNENLVIPIIFLKILPIWAAIVMVLLMIAIMSFLIIGIILLIKNSKTISELLMQFKNVKSKNTSMFE